jgi:hypothetical protein
MIELPRLPQILSRGINIFYIRTYLDSTGFCFAVVGIRSYAESIRIIIEIKKPVFIDHIMVSIDDGGLGGKPVIINSV